MILSFIQIQVTVILHLRKRVRNEEFEPIKSKCRQLVQSQNSINLVEIESSNKTDEIDLFLNLRISN